MVITFIFAVAFFLNMIGALGLKSLIEESDMRWLMTKPVRVVLLIPPVSIVVLSGAWLVAITMTIVEQIKDYLD